MLRKQNQVKLVFVILAIATGSQFYCWFMPTSMLLHLLLDEGAIFASEFS
jgi:hypothetical protein